MDRRYAFDCQKQYDPVTRRKELTCIYAHLVALGGSADMCLVNGRYREEQGHEIAYGKFGCCSLLGFFESHPDYFEVRKANRRSRVYIIVARERSNSIHILRMARGGSFRSYGNMVAWPVRNARSNRRDKSRTLPYLVNNHPINVDVGASASWGKFGTGGSAAVG